MDEVELRHWMALSATRAALAALCAGEAVLRQFPSTQAFQVGEQRLCTWLALCGCCVLGQAMP